METELWQPKRPGAPNEAALSVMNPANEQRILDTLTEARKHPGLEQGMVPWYVMDPMYQRMVELVGPERAAKEYMDFNMSVTPFSAGSSVPSEINRGTAANMMRQRGEYDIFKQYGGIAVPKRGADYPEALRDVKGMMGHLNQANPVERYFEDRIPRLRRRQRKNQFILWRFRRAADRFPDHRRGARRALHTRGRSA